MSSVATAIELTDRMSYPLQSITSALNSTLSVFEDFKSSVGESFDDSKINSARIAIDSANASIEAMQANIKKSGNEQNNLNNKIDETANKMNNATNASNSFFKSLMGASIVQKVFSLITGQVDNAINRLDILNNYPKVMSNLGISADQANASMNMLNKGLKGLPTTLNDAVSSVQNFTSVNGNVGKSTKMFLALNNAILAGGGSTQIQQSALEQLSQAYAKGKPDMMEWRTAMTAMPAQLKQVATAMGYINTTSLGDDLRAGKVSMNDFMNTLIKLNQKGVEGFQSLEEQARNATGGIATSIANMKSAITRGISDIITKINGVLEKIGLPNIQTIISNFGTTIENVLGKIGDFAGTIIAIASSVWNAISTIINILMPVINIIQAIGDFVRNNWGIIEPILQAIIIVLGAYYTYTLLAKIGTQILTNAFNMLTNPMFLVMLVIVAIIAVLIYLWNTNDDVANGMLFIWDSLQLGAMALKLGVQTAFYAIILAGLTMYEGFLGVKMGLQTAFYAVVLAGQTMALGFQGVFEAIVNAGIWMYNKIVDLLNKLGGSFQNMDYADFTSGTVDAISKTMGDYAKDIAKTYDEMNDVSDKISEYSTKLNDVMNNGATQIQNKAIELNATREDRVKNRTKLTNNTEEVIKKAIGGATDAFGNDDILNNIAGNTGNTAGNTGAIKDTLSATEEDLKYLRDIAEREVINRFTTAEININMTNNNNINSEADLDGIINSLSEGLYETMEMAAEGVHE